MAYEGMMNPSFDNISENPEPFVWTEDAHSLYLTFLEEAFVNDLYHRHYCSLDICGCSPSFASTLSAHASTAAAAESPSSAPTQYPSAVVLPYSEPETRAKTNSRHRGSCTSIKKSSLKRKGKWPSQEAGLETEQVYEHTAGLQDAKCFLEQRGSSSHSDYVVPRVLHGVSKRSRVKYKMDGAQKPGTDQVVPLDYETRLVTLG